MNVTLIMLVVLAALSAGGVAYAVLFNRIESERTAQGRLARMKSEKMSERVRARAGADAALRRKRSLSDTLKELENQGKAKEKKRITLTQRLYQAGLPIGRQGYLAASTVLALVVAVGTFIAGLPPYAWLAGALVGGIALPAVVLGRLRKRRLAKFRDEFAGAIDVIVRGVKAGLPLNECIQIVSREANEPVCGEFQRIVEAQKLGVSVADAVDRMPEAVPIAEVNFFAIVIGIQQRAGGNLSEALGNLSGVLRDRKRMVGKIKALSMEAKASGYIIAALPFIVAVLVYITSPDYIMLLFRERIGHMMLGGAAIWMSMGIWTMRKMINFDF